MKGLLKNKKIISSLALTLTMLIVTLLAVIFFVTKAWFATNEKTNVDGLEVVASSEYITYSDTIDAKVVMNTVTVANGTYKRETDTNYYYLYDTENATWMLDDDGNKRAMSYDSLYPGEYIEISIKFTCSDSRLGSTYKLYFSGLTDSDTFEHDDKTYSVLGVYKVVPVTYDSDGTATEGTGRFLADYNASEIADTCEILTGTFNESDKDADGYFSASFRLYIDLEQYNKLSGVATNTLSEKIIKISKLVLETA